VAFAIKTEVRNARAKAFAFVAQKTMYGGKHIAEGDTIFVFASENERGRGLIARGVVREMERRPARNRAQFQVLPPGDKQDHRHLGRSRGIPRSLFLNRSPNTLTSDTSLSSVRCRSLRYQCRRLVFQSRKARSIC
jgi:hypothetical protein